MKCKNLLSSLVIAASATFACQAHATVMTDNVKSNPDTFINPKNSYSYVHDFTDQGFVLGKTIYTSGSLSVRLTDVSGMESGQIMYGSQTYDTGNVANDTVDTAGGTTFTFDLNALALQDLNADGKLEITIVSTDKNFYFAASTLTADATTAAVPEPVSLALMGAGLAGIGAMRRRKSKA